MDLEMSDVMVDGIDGPEQAITACMIGGPCYSTKCWST